MATKRFAPKLKIKTGDQVTVISGNDKGKTGTVLQVFPDDNRAVVEGVRMVTKHRKPTQTTEGGIVKMEARIHISNLMLVDATVKLPALVAAKKAVNWFAILKNLVKRFNKNELRSTS
jgi:large subunit ribosomal protein L24